MNLSFWQFHFCLSTPQPAHENGRHPRLMQTVISSTSTGYWSKLWQLPCATVRIFFVRHFIRNSLFFITSVCSFLHGFLLLPCTVRFHMFHILPCCVYKVCGCAGLAEVLSPPSKGPRLWARTSTWACGRAPSSVCEAVRFEFELPRPSLRPARPRMQGYAMCSTLEFD